jgi:Protein of unknown function (DUF1203)
MNYRVFAIPTEVAETVRSTKLSPGYGHPAHSESLTEPAPCRHCLRLIRPGERAILFTYDAFHELGRPLPGPVYVHEEPCTRYGEEEGFPRELQSSPRTLTGYGDGRTWIREILVPAGGPFESAIHVLMSIPEVRYVHVRSTDAGCYTFGVQRG